MTKPASWSAGKAKAVALGGHLAMMDQTGENQAVWDLLLSIPQFDSLLRYPAKDGGGATYVWLGGSDQVSEGVWVWVSGASIGTAAWGTGSLGSEPDNLRSKGRTQNFLAIGLENWPRGSADSQGKGNAGQWNDLVGTDRLPYLVEFE